MWYDETWSDMMIQCNIMWFIVVWWCDSVFWCDMMLCNVLRFGVMSCDMIWHGTAWHDVLYWIWCSMMCFSVVWCDLIMWSDDMAWWAAQIHVKAFLESKCECRQCVQTSSHHAFLLPDEVTPPSKTSSPFLLHYFYCSTNMSTPHPNPVFPTCLSFLHSPVTPVVADFTGDFLDDFFTMLSYYQTLGSAKSRLIKILSNKIHQQSKYNQNIYRLQINLTSFKLFLVRYLFGLSDKEAITFPNCILAHIKSYFQLTSLP